MRLTQYLTQLFFVYTFIYFTLFPPNQVNLVSYRAGVQFLGECKNKNKKYTAILVMPGLLYHKNVPPPPPRVKCLPFSVVFRHSRFYTYCKLMVKKKWGGKGKWGSPPPPLFRHTNALIRRVWPNILVLVVALWVTIIPPNFLANGLFQN